MRIQHARGGPAHLNPALTNATFPYLLELAEHGLEGACARHPGLRPGVNTYNGSVTHRGVAESQGREWRELAAVE